MDPHLEAQVISASKGRAGQGVRGSIGPSIKSRRVEISKILIHHPDILACLNHA